MAPTKSETTRVVQFQMRAEKTDPRDVTVSVGDGLRYVGEFERARCPHFRTHDLTFDRSYRPLEPGEQPRATHVLVGPPPKGLSDADLRAAGIGTCVSLDQVELVAPSGQWEYVPAATMKQLLDVAAKAKAARTSAAPAA